MILLAAGMCCLAMTSCRRQVKPVNPAFRTYIQAFTSGILSCESPIRIRLNQDYADSSMFRMTEDKELFSFSPGISGKAYWIDNRTIEFRPDAKLPPHQIYRGRFYLSRLIRVPDSLKTFEFGFRTMAMEYEVKAENHKAYSRANLSKEYLYGTLRTSDVAEDARVEEMLTAGQDGRKLSVSWSHDGKNHLHMFRVDSIVRGESAGSVSLEWKGGPIGAEKDGSMKVEIPALGDFSCLEISTVQETEQYILVRFSDPLQPDQHLAGLIRVGNRIDLRYSIEDNELRIYPPDLNSEKVRVTLDEAIRNYSGKRLGQIVTREIPVISTKPNVRFVGNGVIMPSTNGWLLPFDAVNLRAVDIKVIRIFEKNILQFLQVNELDQQNELYRVGRVVLLKTIPLKGVVDYGQWNRFSIDLSDLIKADPGAMYTISLNFKKKYSVLPCAGSGGSGDLSGDLTVQSDPEAENEKNWSYYSSYEEDNYRDEDWDNYKWEEREDPCKASYYFNKSVSRNVLASDLGILAKAGDDGKYNIFVTDLITTRPVIGAKIELYNFQLQKMTEGYTNGDGVAVLTSLKKPFVAIARKEKQTGYLRLGDGTALSLSMFDVSGQPVQKGIKGFIYGERGVWRPGDSLYLTFILEDKSHLLPPEHPVSFQLYNPQGQLVNRIIRTQSLNGFYNFSTATDRDAPTGNWLAKVQVGSAEFQKTLKIEAVKPNRLKITLDFKSDKLVRDKIRPVTLQSSWLTGAVARNLKAVVNLTLTRMTGAFNGYPGYVFDNPGLGFASENINVFTGKLNEEGAATFTPQIHLTHVAPGLLTANFETMVYEEGGDFSIDRYSLPYYPFSSYVGLKVPEPERFSHILFTGHPQTIEVVNVDADGKLIVASHRIKVEILKLGWQWWWDDTEAGSSADFIGMSYAQPVDSGTIFTQQGRGQYTFTVQDEDWGRYLVKVTDRSSGHSAAKVVYLDWEGYFRMPGKEKQGAVMLTFTSDKESYKVGDKVRMTIPTSSGGRALVTIENGSRVLRSFWVPTTEKSTDLTFETTAEMSPNCYAFVTLLQPHSQTKNDLPIRLYGVIPVRVDNPGSLLKPELGLKEVLVPGKPATITVREARGRPMTYTLAVVDEGLLDLTRFKTPDPWNSFNAKEALGVKTWDLFDLVMGAFSGDLQRILSIGGDLEGQIKGSLKANRFKPMVRFLGPFELKKGATATHTFTLPQYIGSVRVMVVAGMNGAYGSAEKTAFVRKPLMVLGTLPRVLGPGESVSLPVSVFAMEKNIRNVTVTIHPDDHFTSEGETSRSLTFQATGDQLVLFRLNVKEVTGVGKISIHAVCGNETADEDLEIGIRNPNPPVTDVYSKSIPAGGSWDLPFKPAGMEGTNSGTLELSSVPSMNLEKRLAYLIDYPYGCLEQVTSSSFPQLYLRNFVELSSASLEKIDRNVKEALHRMKAFQVSNGGLSLWAGGSYPDDWATSYAGHFMLEAQKQGYVLPVGLLPEWKTFQQEKAVSWTFNRSWYNDDLAQAYRLFTLALAGSPELSAMNKLLEFRGLSNIARWMLAGAYQLAGKPETAQSLTGQASPSVTPYRDDYYTFGSDLRDKAIIAEVLCLMNQKTKAAPLIQDISAELCSENWYSTQSTAFALLAASLYTGGGGMKGVDATYHFNSGAVISGKTDKPFIQVKTESKLVDQPGSLEVTNKSEGPLFARLIVHGTPAGGTESSASNDLKLQVKYTTTDGKPVDITQLPQGTNFIAQVTVSNPGLRGIYYHLALSEVFPSGWEILNARMSAYAQAGTSSSGFTWQDIRDDRVNTFFDLMPNRSVTYGVMLVATYPGRFYLPAVQCEAMYDHTINAREAGKWVQVGPAK
ncbi:MAG TPA: MG2 domain-containing protein [Bacteroidales bacterium]|nr:MG2 domain-containing protein [Bacteroidales bacterium]